MKIEEYEFYLDICKNGSVTHTGLGLGFDRFVMFYTGMSNIRDVVPFPRSVSNCQF